MTPNHQRRLGPGRRRADSPLQLAHRRLGGRRRRTHARDEAQAPQAPDHPHSRARLTYVGTDAIAQPASAPRFRRTTTEVRCAPANGPAFSTGEALERWI
jgi:hypothetical protein